MERMVWGDHDSHHHSLLAQATLFQPKDTATTSFNFKPSSSEQKNSPPMALHGQGATLATISHVRGTVNLSTMVLECHTTCKPPTHNLPTQATQDHH